MDYINAKFWTKLFGWLKPETLHIQKVDSSATVVLSWTQIEKHVTHWAHNVILFL